MRWLVSSARNLMRTQGVLLGLIILMTLLFVAQLIPTLWYYPLMAVPKDVVESWNHLIGAGTGHVDWMAFGSLISCGFLHGSAGHLFGNLVFYWIFGALISELIGWRWLLAIVLIGQLGAGITHVALNPADLAPMLGASGIVSAFMGAYLAMSVRWELPDPHVWPIARPIPPANLAILAIIFVAMDYKEILSGNQDLIAYGAHVGGFTTGLFVAGLFPRMPKLAHARR